MRRISYTGPVTSLEFYKSELFVGHGSDLKFFKHQDSKFSQQWKRRIFHRERIQGIKTLQFHEESGVEKVAVLLWGGKRFQIVLLSELGAEDCQVKVQDEIPTPDWILDAIFLGPPTEDGVFSIAFITAHNTILTYAHKLDIPLSERFEFFPSPERCLLYSACITLDKNADISDKLIIVLSGTIFGEVLLWKLHASAPDSKAKTQLSGRYLSHEGSVFGVSISPDQTLAASCSDDRTIRVWDIAQLVNGSISQECEEIKEPLAIGWSHQARIWGVRFLQHGNGKRLISFSEDLTAKTWILNDEMGKRSLICNETFKTLHSASGKNIWSLATNESETLFVTGAADSGIALWNLDSSGNDAISRWISEPNKQRTSKTTVFERVFDLDKLIPPSISHNGKKMTREEPRQYTAISHHSFLLSTTSGWLLHHDTSRLEDQQWTKLGFWPRIRNSTILRAAPYPAKDMRKYIAAVGDNEGNMIFFECDSTGIPKARLENQDWIKVTDSRPSEILFSSSESQSQTSGLYASISTFKPNDTVKLIRLDAQTESVSVRETWLLQPPETFPFSVILVYEIGKTRFCLAGSRHGAFTVYTVPESSTENSKPELLQPVKVWRHVHDDDTVNSLRYVKSSTTETGGIQFEIISTGRSGSFKKHKLLADKNNIFDLVELDAVYPPALPRLEGYVELYDQTRKNRHELLYGFRGRDFVIWNQTLGIESATLDCEGGNRSWDFSLGRGEEGTQDALLVFTKAKKCHIVQYRNILHNPLIQIPFHGREIKSLAISSQQVIATGAEDTVIRFSYVNPENGELVPLALRKSHTTGVQDLVWAKCGGWVFSSGSIEEVYAWKVNISEADVGRASDRSIGVLREAVYEVSTDTLPDLRVCGLDVSTIYKANGETLGFLVGMVRSDSSIKLAFYDIIKRKFATVAEGFYKTSCLLQIQFYITGDDKVTMFTAGTDGYITIWDITEVLGCSGITIKSRQLFGEIIDSKEPAKLEKSQWRLSHSLHQNSIKTLHIAEIGEDEVVLLTGGDDTGISISRLKFMLSEKSIAITTKKVERAHASLVTAITTLPITNSQSLEFFSSGVDQQVKRWKVDIQHDMANANLEILEDLYINIPDVSSLALLCANDEQKKRNLIVGGVGVEVLEL